MGRLLLSDTITKWMYTGATKLSRYRHSSIREDFHPNYAIRVLIYTVEYKATHNLYFCRFWSKQEDDKPYLHNTNDIQQHHNSKYPFRFYNINALAITIPYCFHWYVLQAWTLILSCVQNSAAGTISEGQSLFCTIINTSTS